jgi:peptide/nickel transport system ATP-binding protein
MSDAPLIEIQDLTVGFTSRSGEPIAVLRNVDLSVRTGESVGIVGESGSGKSTLALAAMGYLKRGLRVLGGSARFRGDDLFAMRPDRLQRLRGGELALIPQNPGQSLSPNLRVGQQIEEVLRLHTRHPTSDHGRLVNDLLARVRLPDPEAIARRYPHELSGDQQQRAAIAMALAGEPKALLLDEPTTGLDVTTQAHILELLSDLATQSGVTMIYVSHDLGAIARVCDRVVVMYAGEVVLAGPKRSVLTDPAHPYARGLLGSIPRLRDAQLPLALEPAAARSCRRRLCLCRSLRLGGGPLPVGTPDPRDGCGQRAGALYEARSRAQPSTRAKWSRARSAIHRRRTSACA